MTGGVLTRRRPGHRCRSNPPVGPLASADAPEPGLMELLCIAQVSGPLRRVRARTAGSPRCSHRARRPNAGRPPPRCRPARSQRLPDGRVSAARYMGAGNGVAYPKEEPAPLQDLAGVPVHGEDEAAAQSKEVGGSSVPTAMRRVTSVSPWPSPPAGCPTRPCRRAIHYRSAPLFAGELRALGRPSAYIVVGARHPSAFRDVGTVPGASPCRLRPGWRADPRTPLVCPLGARA